MKTFRGLLAVLLCTWPAMHSLAYGPEHDQGEMRFGQGLEGQGAGLSFPLAAGQKLDQGGFVAHGSFDLEIGPRCARVPLRNQSGGLIAASCLGRVTGARGEKAMDGICGERPGTWVPLVLVEGSWKDTKTYVQARNRFTAACAAAKVHDPAAWRNPNLGTLAKCVAFWSMHREGKILTACMHMALAAYEGAETHTRNGTPVDAWDKKGSPKTHEAGSFMAMHDWQYNTDPAVAKAMCAMWLEAEWDQNGALCINHRRWEELPDPVKASFPPTTFRLEGFPGEFNCRRGTRPVGDPGRRPEAKEGEVQPGGATATAAAPPVANDRDAVVVNRSELHLLDGGVGPLPAADRALWDTAEAVQLCGHDGGP